MGSKSSHFKYGPGLLLDKTGCIIDSVGFNPEGYTNQGQIVDKNFQHNLRHQVQQQVNANAEPPTYNIINLIEKPHFENDLFMPFIKPFSTYCPQPFETPIYPPFAMPRPIPCPQQDFLSPFSTFCKQAYSCVQQDPSLLHQLTFPISQMFMPNLNLGFNQFPPPPPPPPPPAPQTQGAQLATASQAIPPQFNQPQGTPPIQIQPFFQFYPVPVPQQIGVPTQTAQPVLQAPTLTQKFPQMFNQQLQSQQQPQNQQQQQQQQQLTAMMLQQSPFNLQPNANQKLLQPTQQSKFTNANFGQMTQQLFQPTNAFAQPTGGFAQQAGGFAQPNFLQQQNQFFQSQFTNPAGNFQFNNVPTHSLLEHLSQIMVQPSNQQQQQFQQLQKGFELPTTQVNLGSANFTNQYKSIPITHHQQSIQYIIPPNNGLDARNTQPFDQQGVPNISSALNQIRDSLGPRPLASFDTNSFGNPFLSLHSLVGSQQPMNEPFAQSIEFLMNSS